MKAILTSQRIDVAVRSLLPTLLVCVTMAIVGSCVFFSAVGASAAPAYPAASSVPTTDAVLDQFSSGILAGASSGGVKSVALVRFLCNGGEAKPVSDDTQNRLLEKLLDRSSSVGFEDRSTERYIEVETSLSSEAGNVSSADAVLIGEVFYVPGDPIGIYSIRLFRVSDCLILYAGYSPVSWSREEKRFFQSGTVSSARNTFAQLDASSRSKLQKKAKEIKGGVAFFLDSLSSRFDTINMRVARAQILTELYAGGVEGYEREFFSLAAKEKGRSGAGAFDTTSKASSVASVTAAASPSSNPNFPVVLKIQSTTSRQLLHNVRLTLIAGSTAGDNEATGAGDGLDDRIDQTTSRMWDIGNPVATVEAIVDPEAMAEYMELCVRYFNGDKKKIRRALTIAAITGFHWNLEPEGDEIESDYVAPVTTCKKQLEAAYEMTHGRDEDLVPDNEEWALIFSNDRNAKPLSLVKGSYKEGVLFNYDFKVEWQNGLPYRVIATIDLSPSRQKIINRKQSEEP